MRCILDVSYGIISYRIASYCAWMDPELCILFVPSLPQLTPNWKEDVRMKPLRPIPEQLHESYPVNRNCRDVNLSFSRSGPGTGWEATTFGRKEKPGPLAWRENVATEVREQEGKRLSCPGGQNLSWEAFPRDLRDERHWRQDDAAVMVMVGLPLALHVRPICGKKSENGEVLLAHYLKVV